MAEYKIKLSLQDTLTKDIEKVNNSLGGFAQKTQQMHSKLRVIDGFKKQQKALASSSQKYHQATTKLKQLESQIRQTRGTNKSLSKSYSDQLRSVKRLRSEHQNALKVHGRTKQEIKQLGVSLHNLEGAYAKTTKRIKAFNSVGKLGSSVMAKGRSAFKSFAVTATSIYAPLTVGAYAFKRTFLDTAISFEKFETVLETVEGSKQKAQKSMLWINDFAAKTPYELEGLTEAFVRLRAYGIDPIKGDTLRTLGDTASAMGKPIMQAVEAIADAVTGENERLKEFGIKASGSENVVTYSYTDKDGQQQMKKVAKNNRLAIQQTLQVIWNEKYAGAMVKQSKTFAGMLSNLSDQWGRFQMLVMNAGLFDELKKKLSVFLGKIDELASNGQLKVWAREFAKEIKQLARVLYSGASSMVGFVQKMIAIARYVSKLFGGWQNLIYAILAFKVIIGTIGVGQLGLAFVALAKQLKIAQAMMLAFNVVATANPIGLLVVALVAVGAALVLAYNKIKPFRDAVNTLGQKIKALANALKNSWLGKKLGFSDEVQSTQVATAQQPSLIPQLMPNQSQITVDVTLNDNQTTIVTRQGGQEVARTVRAHPLANEGMLLAPYP